MLSSAGRDISRGGGRKSAWAEARPAPRGDKLRWRRRAHPHRASSSNPTPPQRSPDYKAVWVLITTRAYIFRQVRAAPSVASLVGIGRSLVCDGGCAQNSSANASPRVHSLTVSLRSTAPSPRNSHVSAEPLCTSLMQTIFARGRWVRPKPYLDSTDDTLRTHASQRRRSIADQGGLVAAPRMY